MKHQRRVSRGLVGLCWISVLVDGVETIKINYFDLKKNSGSFLHLHYIGSKHEGIEDLGKCLAGFLYDLF